MDGRARIGLLTGGYFEYWRMYPGLDKIVEKEMQQLADALKAEVEVVWSGLADTTEKTEAAGKRFRKEEIDLLVICEGTYFPDYMPVQAVAHLPDVPILLLLTQPHDHVPLDMDYQDAIHHSFGVVGIVQLTGCFSKMGKRFEIMVAALDDPSLPRKVADYAKTVLAVRKLRSLNIGIIGHTFQGMYDLELDKTKLKSVFGPSVIYLEMAELLAIWREVKDHEVNAMAGGMMSKYRCEGPGENDIKNACRLGLAMEQMAAKYGLAGLSHLCQHLIHVETGTTPCYAATRLIDKGVMVTCEGDIGNLVCMCLVHLLTGDVPCFVEWGMYDTRENAVLLVHHGAGSPRLARCCADVCIAPTGEKWGFKGSGASFRFMGKPGRVTLASLIDDAEGWRMLVTGGEAIETACRPYFGQQFMVRVDQPVKEYLESLCRRGVTHHVILSYGDWTAQLKKAAELLKIEQFVL